MTGDKVRKIPRKIQYKGLAKTYPRAERSNSELSADDIEDKVLSCYPPATDSGIQVSKPTKPNPNSVLLVDFDTADLDFHNTLLAYRMLNLLYGSPDVLACRCIPVGNVYNCIPLGMEWGYLLKCYVPDNDIPRRSYPLFRAREVLEDLAAGADAGSP